MIYDDNSTLSFPSVNAAILHLLMLLICVHTAYVHY